MLWSTLVAVAVSAATWIAGTFDRLDQAYVDLQARWLQEEVASEIVIVEIDARSLKELGHWPLPRSEHATLVENLSSAGAERIFIDIDFSTPSSPSEDARLQSALAAIRKPVVLPVFWQPTSHEGLGLVLNEPLPEFKASAQLGLVNLVPGTDGLVREIVDLSDLPSNVQPVWTHYTAGMDGASGALPLDYRIAPSSFKRISYVDALRGQIGSLQGATVFIGATALELGDIVAVPLHRALPGVVVQAIAVESARRGTLTAMPPAQILVALVAWVALCGWLLRQVKWRHSPLVTLVLILAALVASAVAHDSANLIIPVSPFVWAAIVMLTGSLLASLDLLSWRAVRAFLRTRDQDALLRQVVEHSSDAILSVDAQGLVRTANPSALFVFGQERDAIVGAHLAMLSPELFKVLQTRADDHALVVRSDGSRVVLEITRAELQWESQLITTLTMRDITAQRMREEELRHMAMHDVLTGLPNRAFLADRLEAALKSQTPSSAIALLMLDLDGFKEVNDTLGHSMGDALLVEVSARLARFATDDRYVARIGGDEFAVLWRMNTAQEIGEFAQQLLLVVEEPISIKGIPVSLGTSIGIARSPEHGNDAESLLQRADVALYVAKRRKTRVEFYDPHEDTHSPRRLEMLTLLRAAVSKGELHLEFQPKVSMQSGAAVEVEALCRWDSPVLGLVFPGEFIGLAEASDVIKPLTEWTIRQALLDCRSWREQNIDLTVAVNLSARHLQDARLPQWLDTLFSATSTEPSWLELEITESAIMADPDRAAKILHALREMGVTLSIDDFGTGYSSLTYLRTLAVNRLKIDRSFVMDIDNIHAERVIVESTIKLAHGLGLQAVAEGIETEKQYSILRDLGCDLGQGFAIAKPMPKSALIAWYRERANQARSVRDFPTLRQSVG